MVSVPGAVAINAQETGEVFLAILEITHPDLDSPLRFVNNYEDIVSNGDTYTAYPFDIVLPDSGGTSLPQVKLTIDNVDRSITIALQSLLLPPVVKVSLILASSPDTVEAGPFSLFLRQIVATLTTVEGTLYFEDILNEPFPVGSFDPKTAPGLLANAIIVGNVGSSSSSNG